MKKVLKLSKKVLKKAKQTLIKKSNKVYSQESIDFFAKNIIKDLPFMSKSVVINYNKYILNKHKDKLNRIKNFIFTKSSKVDDLSQAFEKLNFIRLKIMLLERDINAYRNALKYSFDAKDTNIALQKRIHSKYAKLRKFDTYQNLNLGIIYDKSILGQKTKIYENEAKQNEQKINKKFNSTTTLVSMQRDFIFAIIADRQEKDHVFKEDVNIEVLQKLLQQNPKYMSSLSNIETFTNEYLSHNPGSLSKAFVKFKSEHKNATINSIVKDYLKRYKEANPSSTNQEINNLQKELLTSFTYQDFKDSEIFNSIDSALTANRILLQAKTVFAKMEMCNELKYCLDLPEINNYFKILENKDKIKNYVVSTEKLFVRKIEEEFPEIKSANFIYLYNQVKNLLDTYTTDIITTKQYYVNDFINTVIYNEFNNPNNREDIENTLKNISIGVYKNPITIDAKNNFDLFNKLLVEFNYIRVIKSIEFDAKITNCKLFHGVLVDNRKQPILPIDIQSKIIHLPLEAQVSLARNYYNTNILELLDEFSISDTGELKFGKQIIEFGINSLNSIKRLTISEQLSEIDNYMTINKENYYLENELNLAEYISDGLKDTLEDIITQSIKSPNRIDEDNIFHLQYNEKDDFEDINISNTTGKKNTLEEKNTKTIFTQKSKSSNNQQKDKKMQTNNKEIVQPINDTHNKQENREVIDFRKAKKYIDIILEEQDENKKATMLLRIQKRINSHDLLLSEIQIDNLNEDLNKLKLSLRSPKNYVDHLVEKYTEEKRDTNSLQVGLKLRIRMGNLVLTDEEINTINEAYNFELIQRAELKHKREKFPLLPKYIITGNLKESTKEMLQNPEALVRRVIKKKSNKLTPLDIRLFNILEDK